ncbi:hypothetical protein [Corynebacterium epidermidicanis]|uniref:Uncharacterized protein n=1 Tax=Corynebacterium epidermidicanis TaxID=1050174 RepID=A0A0G3GSY9_9CORY|nr:hypothetical protein [Corynebacterium epidermidicanis]AKK03650.1 hypothetical protein CEPID_09020 [Corynebacterium epidermidicanis]
MTVTDVKTTPKRATTSWAVLAALILLPTLSGCSQIGHLIAGEDPTNATKQEKVEVTETPKPSFVAQQVPQKTGQKPGSVAKDDGLNVEWKILAANNGPTGGTQFKVLVKNLDLNVAVPAEEINKFHLAIPGNGDVPRQKAEDEGLDLPLGPGASTVINVSFNTSPYNLSNSKLTLGNVVFEGYLNL